MVKKFFGLNMLRNKKTTRDSRFFNLISVVPNFLVPEKLGRAFFREHTNKRALLKNLV